MLSTKNKIDFKINNENKTICSECGGHCCKRMGCHFSPRDFDDISFKSLKNEIDKGYISIDWWDGDVLGNDRERTYYLRIRNKDTSIVNASWSGKCMLLTELGCSLDFNDRPLGARALIPRESKYGHCVSKYTKEESCIEWYEYQNILEELVDYFE